MRTNVSSSRRRYSSSKTNIALLFYCIVVFLFITFVSYAWYTVRLLNNLKAADAPSKNTMLPEDSGLVGSEGGGTKVTIFYNVYFPDPLASSSSFRKKKKVVMATMEETLEIIKEQISSRNSSIYPNAPIHYVTLGKDTGELVDCGTNCKRLNHFNSGSELETLNELYQHCQSHKDMGEKVAYLHNKGSYHPSKQNHLLRRLLTKAVFSKECLTLSSPPPKNENEEKSDRCNVCSARFSPLPHAHTPGNMWVADCAYVAALVPPPAFGAAMDAALRTAPRPTFGRPYDTIAATHVGRGRFAAEHWVHSHPDNRPCDVYPGPYTWSLRPTLPTSDAWETTDLQRAPRFPFLHDYNDEPYLQGMLQRRATNEAVWFTLAGRMHEWNSLYHAIPHKDSWVWKYYGRSDFFSKME